MNQQFSNSISGYKYLKKLRIALAIMQGTRLLSVLQQQTEVTISHDQAKRVTYLTGLFSGIHRDIFHDWKEQATSLQRPGSMIDPQKRRSFRKTIGRLVLDEQINSDTAIFDNNGFVIKTDNIAKRLADFYHKMRSVRPFEYGNRMSLDFFMIVLGKLPAFKNVYEQGIDFRRLEVSDAVALHSRESTHEDITRAFQHALDPTRNQGLNNKANDYGTWPENKCFFWGIPFLSHITEEGADCIVTVNGGLVRKDSLDEELDAPGTHIAKYPPPPIENIIGYLSGTEELRKPGIFHVDGFAVAENGQAPLFCLDVNILTGLRTPSHTELVELIKECQGEQATVFNLANNESLKAKVIQAAEGDERLQLSVDIAFKQLAKITQRLEAAKAELFATLKPVENPKLFLCMGGAGSGKTAVEEVAQAQCGDNFIITSLDEFRKKSELYCVLTAANHHSDDYIFVEPFANRLRDLVANYAREQGYNILYDGTGIPYSPRYTKIIQQFKQAGFNTQITAVDAFIVKPKGREGELQRSTIIESVKDRYIKSGRALPWVVTVYKHIRVPESFLQAMEDHAVDKISLFANDGAVDKHYLVAESFHFTDREVRTLHGHQLGGTLASYFKGLVRGHPDSVLKHIAEGQTQAVEALISRFPSFDEENVAYQVYPGKEGNRVLVVYNTRRMVDFVEKRQLNPNASGDEGLLHKPEALAFLVDPLSEHPWLTSLQDFSAP